MKSIHFIITVVSGFFGKRLRRASTVVKVAMLLLLPLAVLAASCSRQNGDKHDHHAVEAEESHHHEGAVGPLTLNNGEKWEADEHTVSVVKDMKSELSDFEKAGKEDYHVLADSLTRQLSVLVAGCTMTGPAHEELHKWLVPLTQNVKGLTADQEKSAARDGVKEIKESLAAFDDFFEWEAN